MSSIFQLDEELEALLENGEGLSDEKEVVSLCRLMVRVETTEQKLLCLKLIRVRTPFFNVLIYYIQFWSIVVSDMILCVPRILKTHHA